MFRLRHLYGNRRFRLFLPALIGAIIWATLPAYSAGLFSLLSNDLRLYAGLSGAPIGGITPGGVAEYRDRLNGRRELTVSAGSVNLPVGTLLNVVVNGASAGQMGIDQFSNGYFHIETYY